MSDSSSDSNSSETQEIPDSQLQDESKTTTKKKLRKSKKTSNLSEEQKKVCFVPSLIINTSDILHPRLHIMYFVNVILDTNSTATRLTILPLNRNEGRILGQNLTRLSPLHRI